MGILQSISNGIATPLGSAASGFAGSLVNNLFNLGQAKKQREHQQQLAEYSYNKDLEMWNKSNEYNSPTAQMERLKAAGLNPNLVYGNGSATGNTTQATTPKYQAYTPQYAQLQAQLPNVLNTLGMYQDVQNKKAQYELTMTDVERKKLENLYLGEFLGNRNVISDLDKKRKWADLMPFGMDENEYWGPYRAKQKLDIDRGGVELIKTQSGIRQLNLSSDLMQLDKNLKEKGVQGSDWWLLRMAIQNGFVGDWINLLKHGIKK